MVGRIGARLIMEISKLLSRFQIICLVVAGLGSGRATAADEIGYNRDIRPILSDKCFHCHGPDAGTREADLRLDVRDEAIKLGAIVPGKPNQSEIITRIHETDPDEVMPPPEAAR
jgi:hypothetical protein